MVTKTNDQDILAHARQFDEDALAAIFDRYNAGIYRYSLRMLGDPDMARECMSETFHRFLNALNRGSGPTDYLQAYLYRIAHNWITDYYRCKIPPSLPLDLDLRSDPAIDPSEVVSNEFDAQRVHLAIAKLTPDQRTVITLKYLEKWENEEIASVMNKPVGAVKSLHHRAIASLRRMLDPEMELDYATC